MRTIKNILYATFIGLKVEISKSSDRKLEGLKGTIVDETKNLIVIEKGDDLVVRIPKVSSEFLFTLDDGSPFRIEGRRITFRPHERAKKVAKRI